MIDVIFGFNWLTALLVVFVCFINSYDKSFSKKVRIEFHSALILCFILSLLSQHLSFSNVVVGDFTYKLVLFVEAVFRPLILVLLIWASEVWGKYINIGLFSLYIISLVFVFLHIDVAVLVIFVLLVCMLVATILYRVKSGDAVDYLFSFIVFAMIVSAAISEAMLKNINGVNNALCVVTSLYYCYWMMRTLKKDKLTGLLLRHNMQYEMADLQNKEYDIVLIDVDNFKLINDKYGHDKGDEALVNVVNAVRNNLPKGCRMYRFGGDEFVIISRKVDKDTLAAHLEYANSDLARKDLHVSFGIVRHMPKEDSNNSLTAADKIMYENKRSLKSEDIWDTMTGLYNYRGFLDELDLFRNIVEREGLKICLLAIDVDRLSNINMAYGHAEGNLVISTLSRILKHCLTGRSFLGHLGSDEFVVAIECNDINDQCVDLFINQLIDGMDSAYEFGGKDYSVKLNIARFFIENNENTSSDEYVNNVLYIKQGDKENRRKNGNDDGEKDYNVEEEKLVLDVIENNRLNYAFQPIISAKDGAIIAYEALMRADTEPMISPLKVLRYAERNNLSREIEKLTLFNVLERVANGGSYPEDAKIFVNSIPGCELLAEEYTSLVEKYGHIFNRMVIEITEQREIEDDKLAELNIKRSQDGFKLAIDDYGSGCSNTNSLLRYMPQVVKLDRLLITGIDRNSKKQFFVDSIITFARDNDMLILAEGVETEAELKTVIRLGVDLIQGYVVAKPAFDILTEIPNQIKKIIIEENLRVGDNHRMVYTAGDDSDLSVVRLAMEDYSKIIISGENVNLTGSQEYTADLVIKIKDNCNCQINMSDVRLNSVDDEPCIDIGENCNLVLNLEGNNRINGKGIKVPEGSSLQIIGTGSLEMYVKGHQCYAIGNDTESAFGSISIGLSGLLSLNVDGEECVGIGGGIAEGNAEVRITAGRYLMNVAGVDAVGFGYYSGDAPISIKDCIIESSFRVNSGTLIGTLNGKQSVNVENFSISMTGSGTDISVIGSVYDTDGSIILRSGSYISKVSGHNIYLLGANSGELDIDVGHVRLELIGEGDNVVGFGTKEKSSHFAINDCSIDMVINAASPLWAGNASSDINVVGLQATIKVNGDEVDLHNI